MNQNTLGLLLFQKWSKYFRVGVKRGEKCSLCPLSSHLRSDTAWSVVPHSWPLRTFPLTCSIFSTCLFLLREPFFKSKISRLSLDFPVERSRVNNLLFILLCVYATRAEPMRDGTEIAWNTLNPRLHSLFNCLFSRVCCVLLNPSTCVIQGFRRRVTRFFFNFWRIYDDPSKLYVQVY